MSIRRLVYLTCDECLKICDGSDGDDAVEARGHGRRAGWRRIERRDLCPACQGDRTCGRPYCNEQGGLVAPGVVRCHLHEGDES